MIKDVVKYFFIEDEKECHIMKVSDANDAQFHVVQNALITSFFTDKNNCPICRY